MASPSLPIPDWDAVSLSRAIAAREVSCSEVMGAFLQRIEAVNSVVNAIVSLRDPDTLMAEAKARDADLAAGRRLGPLHGFPQAIKDLAPCAGFPTVMGSRLFVDAVAEADGIMAERMRAGGAIFVGKTNVPEFGFGSQTVNEVFGATLNAYDHGRTCGGSSGGAAVAVATGMLPVADGSDHGGSLRNPAAWGNIFGLRPSYGRVPGATDEVFLPAMTVQGPMARSVPDLALLLSVQAGYDGRVPNSIHEDPALFAQDLATDVKGWRVGWLGDLGGKLPFEPGVLDLCERGLDALRGLGVSVEGIVPDFDLESVFQAWMTLRSWGIAAARGGLYADPAKRGLLKEDARWEIERGQKLSAVDVDRASRVRTAWYEAIRRLFDRYDALILPGAQVFPFDVKTLWPKEVAGRPMDTYHRWMEVMVPFTMANVPAISVPVGFSASGLPMGMQIAAPNHGELKALRLAHAYDGATNWVRRHPPPLPSRSAPGARR